MIAITENFYFNQDKKKDFWLIPFPEFVKDQNFLEKIKETNFYNQKTPLFFSSNLVALISSNEDFIKWVELRVGYFENIESNYLSVFLLSIFSVSMKVLI